MKLLKVIYIGRHGERAPVVVPPDLKKDWIKAGGLTSKGAKNQYDRGIQFKSKYSEFFKELNNSPKNIYCRVSDFDRIMDSAYYFLSGILSLPFVSFESLTNEKRMELLCQYGSQLPKIAYDIMYRGHFSYISPKLEPLYKSLHDVAINKREYFSELLPLLPKAYTICNPQADIVMDYNIFYRLYDVIECYYANDKPLPKILENVIDFKAFNFIRYFCEYNLGLADATIRRVCNHYLFVEIIKHLEEPSNPMFYYCSYHDKKILALLLAIGYPEKDVPDYSTGVTIEVYKSSEERFVNIDYVGKNINKLLFPKLTTEYIPIEDLLYPMKKECFKDDEEFKIYSGNKDFDYKRDYLEPESLYKPK